MTNIDYVLFGYDIFYGNPKSIDASVDPGFRDPIFDKSYTSDRCSEDGRFRVPNGVRVLSCGGNCQLDFVAEIIKGARSYQSLLDVKVTITHTDILDLFDFLAWIALTPHS